MAVRLPMCVSVTKVCVCVDKLCRWAVRVCACVTTACVCVCGAGVCVRPGFTFALCQKPWVPMGQRGRRKYDRRSAWILGDGQVLILQQQID